MRRIIEFLKSAALGGFFGVLPIVLLVLVVGEALEIVEQIFVDPVAEGLGVVEIGGIDITGFTAIFLLVAFCVVFGYAIGTKLGSRLGRWVNRSILDRIPGLKMIRTVTGRLSGRMEGTLLSPALVTLPGGWSSIAFIVEELADGRVAVFVPTAPTPTVGHVYLVEGEQVKRLDASGGKVLECLMQWGIGSKDFLQAEPAKQTE